jgi:hypothetical protein
VALPARGTRHLTYRRPSGRRSIVITACCFDGRFVSDAGSGSGNISIADHS